MTLKTHRIGILLLLALCAGPAVAHVSEGGFVLLLPTGVYTVAGVASVALTALLLILVPTERAEEVFSAPPLVRLPRVPVRYLTSSASFLMLCLLIWVGLTGPRDPLTNPLPLTIWTVWWIGLVAIQGLFFDLWRWINPWAGPVALLRHIGPGRRPRLPLGHGIGIASFLALCALIMVDPAPSDPARLAWFLMVYLTTTLIGVTLFGPRWLYRAEAVGMLMRSYGRVRILGKRRGRLAAGLPGWQVLHAHTAPLGLGLFALILLGGGSFDGLNETFWWFDLIGINPLAFPGRSAVIFENLTGLLVANAALLTAFALTLLFGLRLIRAKGLVRAMRIFAPSLLPIALGYHIAHYLTAFLVDGQYALAALNDPLSRGNDLLGMGQFYVTTGFFNTQGTVRIIWLSQAGAVVIGHILAILLAHALAVRHYGTARRAVLLQAPLAVFMVFYTLFGLWLLASPRGA